MELTAEGSGYATNGTPEFQYAVALEFNVVTSKADVEAKVGAQIAKIGFAKAMSKKWVKLAEGDKNSVVRMHEGELQDEDMLQLIKYRDDVNPANHDKKMLDALKKRKLVTILTTKSYNVSKGANYAAEKKKLEVNLTADMLRTGTWKNLEFKKTNINALGEKSGGGHLHPLMKVRSQFRQTLLEMGFNEMPTDRFVESSFWNFDSLF